MAVWPLSLMGAVYLGIADRALELAVAGSLRKRSIAIERGAYAYNPMVQHQIAEMYLELDAATATLDRFAGDWVAGADIEASLTQRIYSTRSEEPTSELQSLMRNSYAVFCLKQNTQT